MERIKHFINESLEKALNTYLALDPESEKRLASLNGKIVTIELSPNPVIFHLIFMQHKVQLVSGGEFKADTIIKGTPLRLLHLSFSHQKDRQKFFADDISIQGNLELGQQVIDLFDQVEIDWEEHLSRFIGDSPSHQIGRITSRIRNWTEQVKDTLMQDINEYLHEEIQLVPPLEAVKDFFTDVDLLRMDTDRLDARVQLLKSRLAEKRGEA